MDFKSFPYSFSHHSACICIGCLPQLSSCLAGCTVPQRKCRGGCNGAVSSRVGEYELHRTTQQWSPSQISEWLPRACPGGGPFFVTVFFLGSCYKQRSFQGLVYSTHQYHTCDIETPMSFCPLSKSHVSKPKTQYSPQTTSFSGTSNFGILMPDIDGA